MSSIRICNRCGGNIVAPSYPGDGAYPVGTMCRCPDNQPNPSPVPRS